MKHRPFFWAALAAAFLLSSLCSTDGQAYWRAGYGYTYPSYLGGGIGMPYAAPTWGYGYMPMYNPYIAPYPIYSILPPHLPYGYYHGYDQRNLDPRYRRKSAEDYGYPREFFDDPPRKRISMYPAVRADIAAAAMLSAQKESVSEGRRVHVKLLVPTEDTIVWIDGKKTSQLGRERVYATPPMPEGLYTMTIRAEWIENGKRREATHTVDVVPGWNVEHQFK